MSKNENAPRKRLERLSQMEAILDETVRLNADLAPRLAALDEARGRMKKLFRYYGSATWHSDRESELPEGVKAGVLSEDLVYDEIVNLRDEAFLMLELATDILKNVL